MSKQKDDAKRGSKELTHEELEKVAGGRAKAQSASSSTSSGGGARRFQPRSSTSSK
jgi:lactobin A/cerein 7B family class IIb bacteriocin